MPEIQFGAQHWTETSSQKCELLENKVTSSDHDQQKD